MRLLSRLDRPRRLTLAAAVALVVVGGLLVVLTPGQRLRVPVASTAAEDGPVITYVRSLPDAGDADLTRPVGLAIGAGRLYVADSGAAVVRVFSTAGRDLGEIGRGVLQVPASLAYDVSAETLLVADRQIGAVLRFTEAGRVRDDLRPAIDPAVPWAPLGVAVDGEGLVAVTDSSGRHRVLVMNRSGAVLLSLGSLDASGTAGGADVIMDFPGSVAFSDGEIWVSDGNNRRVVVFGRDGVFRRFVPMDGVARGLTSLTGGTGPETYVAVVDALASDIMLVDAEGDEVARYGEPGATAGQLAYPNDVVYDPGTSQLFVADTGNARVQVWRVTWPAEMRPAEVALQRFRFSPMGAFGLVLAVVGAVAAVIALSPQRREGAEVAVVAQRPDRS